MTSFPNLTLRFDGSCSPNPGEGGSGYVFSQENGNLVLQGRYYVGTNATNNVAEYFGLIAGLRSFRKSGNGTDTLYIEGDSELVINQLKGKYKVTSPRLKKLHRMALKELERGKGISFNSYKIEWIDRRFNHRADALANDARVEKTSWVKDYY